MIFSSSYVWWDTENKNQQTHKTKSAMEKFIILLKVVFICCNVISMLLITYEQISIIYIVNAPVMVFAISISSIGLILLLVDQGIRIYQVIHGVFIERITEKDNEETRYRLAGNILTAMFIITTFSNIYVMTKSPTNLANMYIGSLFTLFITILIVKTSPDWLTINGIFLYLSIQIDRLHQLNFHNDKFSA